MMGDKIIMKKQVESSSKQASHELSRSSVSTDQPTSRPTLPSSILRLQSTLGNRATHQLLDGDAQDHQSHLLMRQYGSSLLQRQGATASTKQDEDEQATTTDPDQVQGDNWFKTGAYLRLTGAQQRVIDAFVAQARSEMDRWIAYRNTGTFDHFNTQRLTDLYDQVKEDFRATQTYLSAENMRGLKVAGSLRQGWNNIPLMDHPIAITELRRQLLSGHFTQFLREIRYFNPDKLSQYSYLLGVEADVGALPHHYELVVDFGAEADVGMFGGTISNMHIYYHNDLGMTWEMDLYGGSLSMGAGIGSPVTANVEIGDRGDQYSYGTANKMRYYSPEYFQFTAPREGEASMQLGGVNKADSAIVFGDVVFDTSGTSIKAGSDTVIPAGAEISVSQGGYVGSEPYNKTELKDVPVEDKPEEKPDTSWQPYIQAAVHFPTESANLDDADTATLTQLVDKMVEHARAYSSDIFKLEILGLASERWREPEGTAGQSDEAKDAQGYEYNLELAMDRGWTVETAIRQMLMEKEPKIMTGLLRYSEITVYGQVSRNQTAPNDPKQRGALVQVQYNPGEAGTIENAMRQKMSDDTGF
jgi:hypothetical protein